MKTFNVIIYDFNKNKFISYNIIPYFVKAYKNREKGHKKYPNVDYYKIPKTFSEFKEFIKKEAQYQFWSRCEYEIVLVDWPSQKTEEKWDVFDQIEMNLEVITKIVMECIQKKI